MTGPPSVTVTLDGPRTIGDIYFNYQNWTLNTGTGGPLTIDATFGNPVIYVFQPGQTATINAALAGVTGMEKLGDGALVLAGTNTYTGETLATEGILLVNRLLVSSPVTVDGGILGGTGLITGAVTVQAGSFLAPGTSLGTLTISNSLTLQPGSSTYIEVNAQNSAHDFVQGLSSVSYGGSLVVSNLTGTLSLGQSFPIFSAQSSSGNFTNISPNPGAGLRWKFNPGNGTLSVVSSALQPRISSITAIGTNLVLRATNGAPSATAYLVATTNLTQPRTIWPRIATNSFDVSGNLIVTNAIVSNIPWRFLSIATVAGP